MYAPLRTIKDNNSNGIGHWPLIFYYKATSYQYLDVSAKFDKYPSLTFQDIKEKPKRHGRTNKRTHGRTDGRMDGRTDGWTDGRTDGRTT